MQLKVSSCLAASGLAVALGLSLAHSAQAQVRPPAGLSAGTRAQASASTRTCASFATWSAHRSNANLLALLAASESVPFKYLGNDVAYLYVAVRQGDLKFVESEMSLVRGDCSKVTLTATAS